jgi:hypothetical protein
MGTRCLTVFCDEEEEIVVMYRQMDGYPSGHGAELKEFLSGFSVVNGYGFNPPRRQANGMGCLAAQTVAHFKTGIGNFYLCPAGARNCGEEYIYTVNQKEGRVWMKVQAGCVTFFGLPGTKQEHMPCLFEGFIEDFDPEEAEAKWRDCPEEVPNDFSQNLKDNI